MNEQGLLTKDSVVVDTDSKLNRHLRLLEVFSIAAGAMISSGLFVLPGIAFEKAGPAIILSYAIAGLLNIPVMLSQIELSTAIPKTGGAYVHIERSLGPLLGAFAGLANWLSMTLKATFALVGIGALGTLLMPGLGIWGIKVTAIFACLGFALLITVSTKGSGKLQVILVVVLLTILTGYVITGFKEISAEHYTPPIPHGWQTVFAVSGMVFIAYGGLTKVANLSEEIVKPGRTLPRGMFLAFAVVTSLYVMVVFVTVGILKPSALAGSLTPISLGAKVAIGKWGELAVSIAAFLAFATTANAGIMAASRAPLAMSRDGLIPEFFATVNKRFGTPHRAIAVTVLFSIVVITLLSIEDLVKTASTMLLILFALINAAVIVMRQSGIQNYRPTFRAPLYPWLQIMAIILYSLLIVQMGWVPLLIAGGFALVTALWYIFYIRLRIERESAFVFMVKNVVSSKVARSNLEDELKAITLERDSIAHDRFDHLVKDAVVLDLPEKTTAQNFFHQLSEALSTRLGIPAEELYQLFIERERQSSTVIRPGLAIPHIIVEGRGVFELLIARCKEGIVFSELHSPVTTVFALVGSRDERNYHLRALMNIAHIVGEAGFQERWLQARGPEEMRDIILLSGRKREHPHP